MPALVDNASLKKAGNSSALYVIIIVTHCGIHLSTGGKVLVIPEQNSPVALNFSWKPMH
jgi:hypothetical protein